MKKIIFLSAFITLVTTGVFAREVNITPFAQGQMSHLQGTPEERAKRHADQINATVQLSADQYTRVLAIAKDFTTQRDALRNSGTQGDDMRAKFQALGQQEDAQLKGVLTADQYTKYLAAKKNYQGQHHGGGGN